MSTMSSPGTLTWLQAAEHVLREEGPEMHIRDLTNRILEQGIVKSNCATSLETLLYRHTSGSGNVAVGRGRAGSSYASAGAASGGGGPGGGQSLQSSKFVRVPGKHGWFGLRDPHSLPSVGVVPSIAETEERMLMETMSSNDVIMNDDHTINGGVVEPQELSFESKAFYASTNMLSQPYSRKRRHSYHSSGGESVSSLSGGSEDELAGDMGGEMGDGDGSSEFTSDDDSGADEALFRKKYMFVKRVAKNMIHENAALASQMVIIREKISKAQAEKKFLMERLANFERAAKLKPVRSVAQYKPPPHQTLPRLLMANPSSSSSNSSLTNTAASTPATADGVPPRGTKVVSRLSEKVPLSGRGVTTKEGLTTASSRIQQALTKPVQQVTTAVTMVTAPSSQRARHPPTTTESETERVGGGGANLSVAKRSILMSESSSSSESDSDSEKELSIVQHEPITFKSGKGPGKRGYQKTAKQDHSTGGGSGGVGVSAGGDGEEELELAMRCGKVRRLHPIALNQDGSPVYPIVIGGLKVYNLGEIIYDRPSYHSERYILPVGFESSRTYPSTLNPADKCSYTCRILDGGDNPVFEMVPEDDPSNPIRASSSTACQTIVLKKINKARDKQATNSGSGPEFFGYSNPTILNLLQKMPDAKKCSKYKFVRFAEPSTKSRRSATSSFAARVGKRGMTKGSFLKRGLKGIRGSTVATKRGKRSLMSGSSSLKSEEHSRESASVGSPGGDSASSLAIAPVLGTGHGYGMDTMSYSSSNEASDNELVIDG